MLTFQSCGGNFSEGEEGTKTFLRPLLRIPLLTWGLLQLSHTRRHTFLPEMPRQTSVRQVMGRPVYIHSSL